MNRKQKVELIRRALESPGARPLHPLLTVEAVRAYKVFRVRADGSLGPLFVGMRTRVAQFEWVLCDETLSPPDWISRSRRPGWHAKTSLRSAHALRRGGPGRAIFEVFLLEPVRHKKTVLTSRWLWVGRRLSR